MCISPFRGLRYKFKDLSRLICPPYDVISEKEKLELLKLSPYNFVRIELPDTLGEAKSLLDSWIKKDGILKEEKKEAIYIYSQKFELQKNRYKERLGIIALLDLDSKVMKHEITTQGPVEERLAHMKSLGIISSPIFCILSEKGRFFRLLRKFVKKKPIINFKTKDGIYHKLFIITDEKSISEIKNSVKSDRLLIADGHHRYEAAYRLFKSGGNRYLLCYICSSKDEGIVILPTHRVVYLSRLLKEKMEKFFSIKRWEEAKLKEVSKDKIFCYFGGEFCVLNYKGKEDKTRPAVVLLHKFLLDEIPASEIFYTNDISEAIKRAGEIDGIAFLLKGLDIETIMYEVKRYGFLPPKTTYFYPKVPAGIVIYKT